MLVRNWKLSGSCYAIARQARTDSIVRHVVHPTKLRQNLRVFWKLVNLQDCVWENHCRIIMKDHVAGKGDNSSQHYNLVHKFFLCFKP